MIKFTGANAAGDFANHLKQIRDKHLKSCFVSILHLVGDEALKEARDRIIGRVTPLEAVGFFNPWEPLKDATVDRKAYQGLGKGGDPRSILYATGAMAESLAYRVEKGKLRVILGTDDEIAQYHEYGTSRMAPRPFLGPAMIRTVERLHGRMSRAFSRTLKGLPITRI